MLSKAQRHSVIMMLLSIGYTDAASMYCKIEVCREAAKKQDDEELYYSNQDKTATLVTNEILNNNDMIFQMVIARTQTGKTGCMIAVIEKCFEYKTPAKRINPNNIFVITGLSSNDWKGQTSDRMPFLGNDRVYHRDQLKKMAKVLQGKRDVLIIIDEVHIACKAKMSIDKMMKELNYKDTENLQQNNINFVEFSATPKAILKHHKQWEKEGKAKIHMMSPGEGYKGPNDLLKGRAFQFKKLDLDGEHRKTSMNAIREIRDKITETYTSPRFHIIRAPKGGAFEIVKERFIEVFGQEHFDFKDCTSESGSDINEIMKNGAPDGTKPNNFPPPKKHTFIFIKENLRCAVTIKPKKHVGILYERFAAKISEDVIVQGLAGRACGYDVPDDMIVYTDIPSLEDYEKAWDVYFQGKEKFSTKSTFVDPATYDVDPMAAPAPAPKKNNNVIYPRVLTSMDEVRKALKEVEPKMGKQARLGTKNAGSIIIIDGYSVSTKALRKNKTNKTDLKATDRLTKQKLDAIGLGSCIAGEGKKGQRYLVLPYYDNMESPPDAVKYQLRHLNID